MMSTTRKNSDDNFRITSDGNFLSEKLKGKIHSKKNKLLGAFKRVWLVSLLLSVFLWQCQKDNFLGETTGTCPEVISNDPANSGSGVLLNKQISATFNEVMNVNTINTTTFTLKQGTTIIPGTVNYSGVKATFIPAVNLLENTSYTATVTKGARDPAGNALVADHVWSFTTGISPVVISTIPVNGAINVMLSQIVSAVFSKAMNPLTVNSNTFLLKQGSTIIPGAVTYSGTTATFTPTASLTANTVYTGTITKGAMDLSDNPLINDFVWNFNTGTNPTVIFTDPVNGASGVVLSKIITATFSKAMDPSTLDLTSFSIKQGANPILGTITYSGNTLTFTPTISLSSGTVYTGTITTAVKDVTGNPLLSNYTWSFTTGNIADIIRPTVTLTDPLSNATGIALNKVIKATFSELMDPSSISTSTYTLKQGTTLIPGSVTYTGLIASFTPAALLLSGTLYRATVTAGAKDLAGNTLISNYEWEFTTAAPSGPAGINLRTAENYAILAGAGVANTGPTIINGDLGTSPTGTVTGFPPGVVNGVINAADATAATAKLDLTSAFNDGQSRSTGAISLPGNLSGLTLVPGLYVNSTSVMLSAGSVTLDAQGDANAVFIFKMGSTLTTLPGTQVILSGGALAKNIYWIVGSSATLGTNSIFYGNILADQAISLNTGAVLNGRALTRIASVTLQSNIVTKP